jgi:hypothetical protein
MCGAEKVSTYRVLTVRYQQCSIKSHAGRTISSGTAELDQFGRYGYVDRVVVVSFSPCKEKTYSLGMQMFPSALDLADLSSTVLPIGRSSANLLL